MMGFYKNIQGWSSDKGFLQAYKKFIREEASETEPSLIVEVGSWKGKSTAFAATEIIWSNKPITMYAIDTWEGSDEEAHKVDKYIQDGTLFPLFMANLQPVWAWEDLNERHILKALRGDSSTLANTFLDNSIDLLVLDGDHSFDGVRKDITAYWPKVKQGGTIVFDDYNWSGVHENVDDLVSWYGCEVNVVDAAKHTYAWVRKP